MLKKDKRYKAQSLMIRKKFEILSYPKGGKENSISFLDENGEETSFYILYLEDGRVQLCMDFLRVTYQNIEELMYRDTDTFIEHGFMRKTNYTPELKLVPIKSINLDGQSPERLILWWNEEKTPEKVRFRFGSDSEALKYFPDNYYEKLELDWANESVRMNVPLDLIKIGKKYHVNDGWHRLALCFLHGIKSVPALVEIP